MEKYHSDGQNITQADKGLLRQGKHHSDGQNITQTDQAAQTAKQENVRRGICVKNGINSGINDVVIGVN